MRINAVVFDIGQTLVHYPIPLNWSALYRPAFEHIEQKLGLSLSEDAYEHIGETLAKYNTRINPREKEVSSDLIFTEILEDTGIPADLKETVKQEFYNYFRCEAHVYPEAEEALAELAARGIRKDVATIVTQVLVDEADPAFQHPTTPIGAFYDKETAERIAAEKGYTMVEDAGRGYRQVVPSPKPVDVI